MQEIKDDLKAIRSDVSSIKVDVARNTLSLEHHIARSDASEARILYLERLFIGLGTGALVALIGAAIKWVAF